MKSPSRRGANFCAAPCSAARFRGRCRPFSPTLFPRCRREAADAATQIATGKDATILVVLQMAGGNDGLNTVVPYANDFYHQARPRIGLTAR